jgi:cobalamin transport system substrate-binding protein
MWTRTFRCRVALATLFVVGLASCGRSQGTKPVAGPRSPSTAASAAAFPVTMTDDDGVEVTLAQTPQRMVTWAPSNTEILFALGLGSRVVGVSGSFDNYPPEASTITQVAGQGGVVPDVEKVVALHADLVLNGFEGGEDWKKRLRDLGIPVFSIYASTLDDAMHDIRTVGTLTGAGPAADRVVRSMQDTIARAVAPYARAPRVTCFFEAYYPPLTTVGPHTFIFDVLRRAGCDPVTGSAKGDYPEWSVEKLVQSSPLVYLGASESARSVRSVTRRPGFSGIEAVREGRVFPIDSDLVTRPGPRIVEALAEIARDLHTTS